MIFTNTISLVLALAPTTLLAAPTKASLSIGSLFSKRGYPSSVIKDVQDGVCDLSNAVMPAASTPLPAPGTGHYLSHVAVGRGTQNYTCPVSNSSAPTAVGAMASLFNATCESVRAPAMLSSSTLIALNYSVPTNKIADLLLSGHHYFAGDGNPSFDMDTVNGQLGTVHLKKNASVPAPAGAPAGDNGYGSVAWLKLNALSGDFSEVYRVNTAGGNPPKTCDGIIGDFTVQYSAEYWFWKSSSS